MIKTLVFAFLLRFVSFKESLVRFTLPPNTGSNFFQKVIIVRRCDPISVICYLLLINWCSFLNLCNNVVKFFRFCDQYFLLLRWKYWDTFFIFNFYWQYFEVQHCLGVFGLYVYLSVSTTLIKFHLEYVSRLMYNFPYTVWASYMWQKKTHRICVGLCE